MTLFPIVGRELRVAARRPATHWTRFYAAVATVTLWLSLALTTSQNVPVPQMSKNLFTTWFLLGFGIDLVLGHLAKRRLHRRFREMASGPLSKELKPKRAESTAAWSFGHRRLNSAQP